jgi:hypothetical protein
VKREELFEVLEPDEGGLARLRQRLDEPARGRSWALALGGAAFAGSLLFFFLVRRHDVDLMAAAKIHGGVSGIALGITHAADGPVTLESSSTTAMLEVKTTDPRVAFYWVASMNPESAGSTGGAGPSTTR